MHIGDDETPASAGDVDVGGAVVHLTAGITHTCALLDTGAVRCWGNNIGGELGLGYLVVIGDDETPASASDVDVGGLVVQVTTMESHTCALLDSGGVRCWGAGAVGQLGYGGTNRIGDDETPASAGDVSVGGGNVVQVTVGSLHTCVRFLGEDIRCWGDNTFGQLGYGNTIDIGDDELPSSVGTVNY